MEFLDPKHERSSHIRLLLGYCLVALAIGIATLVLLYQSYGYNVNHQGQVTQNGLLFVSSQPSGSAVYLNKERYKSNTNARVTIPSGAYMLRLTQDGYRDWERPVVVFGNDVQHFDYPFLFPKQLKTTSLNDLIASPSIATQSPDKRWLLLGEPNKSGSFEQYDLKNASKPSLSEIILPSGSFTPSDGTAAADTWSPVEWSSDNRHVLLLHTYATGKNTAHEYVLLDRNSSVDSLDLSTTLHLTSSEALSLYNKHVDQFYLYDQTAKSLLRVNANDGSIVSQLDSILSFKTYGNGYVLYVTDKSPTGKTVSGQVSAVLLAGQKTVTLRTLPASASAYVLNLAQYNSDWYIGVGASNDAATYVYKNPQDATVTSVDAYPAPWRRLPLANPSFMSFSSNTQFLLAENGQQFVVCDFENASQYHYMPKELIDQPQGHAVWMDGDRLTYVSNGKLVVFDYDYRNLQTLQAADPNYAPFFAPDFTYLYSLRSASGSTKAGLNSTALVVKK